MWSEGGEEMSQYRSELESKAIFSAQQHICKFMESIEIDDQIVFHNYFQGHYYCFVGFVFFCYPIFALLFNRINSKNVPNSVYKCVLEQILTSQQTVSLSFCRG